MGRKNTRRNYYRNSPAKRRAKRLQRLRWIAKVTAGALLTAGISLGLVFSYDVLTQCDYFTCDTLTVTGTGVLSEAEVLAQARLSPGKNSLSVNLALARKRLLAHPWIAEASVSRTLPNRIDVTVVEHTPVAVLDLERRFLIDARGKIFKEKSAGDPEHLPVVSGLTFSDIIVADQPGSRAYRAVLEVLRLGRNPASVLPNRAIQTISVDREFGLTIVAFDQPKAIKVGYQNYRHKYATLAAVLHHLAADRRLSEFQRIDLNQSGRIVLTPAPMQTPSKEV